MLHETENTLDTELFLKENGEKFSRDCIKAMQLMYMGIRLNGETCKQLYAIHDRRLRDCLAGRPDIVKREWKRDEKGRRLYKEYWIDVPQPPTKKEVIEKWKEQIKNGAEFKQLDLL